ncbi:hypothetical protein GCM10009810_21630 [Nostocoides vanveenii]|uniref:Uncharacterized protein n=1 Tax=Nostocoides vanveenii TaxID=330835 RepID=A0ABP4WSJ6_9MICO
MGGRVADQGDLDIGALQGAGREEPTEAGANDDDTMLTIGHEDNPSAGTANRPKMRQGPGEVRALTVTLW